MSIYDYSVPKTDGTALALSDYKGKVILIVNTATGCGFTPHYEPLEQMYENIMSRGLRSWTFPATSRGPDAGNG